MTLAVVDLHETPAGGALHPLRFTVAQFHALDEAGLLPSDRPVELLDGIILEVDRGSTQEPGMNISIRHANVTNTLFRRLVKIIPEKLGHARGQSPVALTDDSLPQPDLVIVRGLEEDYCREPTPDQIYLLIEVAESSLNFDCGPKLESYARSGISHVWIVDLRNDQLHVYETPDTQSRQYLHSRIIHEDDVINLPAPFAELELPVQQILMTN